MHTFTAEHIDPAVPVWLPVNRAPQLTIAEDDDDIRDALTETLKQDGFRVTSVASGEALVKHLELCRQRKRAPDLIVMDHSMPGWSGLEILEALDATGWNVPVIFMTAYGPDIAAQAEALGARAVFAKPFDVDQMVSIVCAELGYHVKRGPHRDNSPTMTLLKPECAACHQELGVCLEPQRGGVYFCAECWDRARPPQQGEDLGVVD